MITNDGCAVDDSPAMLERSPDLATVCSPMELAGDLAEAGLRLDRWLTDDRAWFTARPAR